MPQTQIGNCAIEHDYPFDPSYGYTLEELFEQPLPAEPDDFEAFWRGRFERAIKHAPAARIEETGQFEGRWKVGRLFLSSTGGQELRGWALLPRSGEVERGFVIGHGYGGRTGADLHIPFEGAALLFPCSRGLGLSASPQLPSDPSHHVVHGIESKDTYLIGGCVEDVWLSVSALLELFPQTAGKVNLLGISFSGGTTLLAAPWDHRISRIHCNVPTFAHQELRIRLPSVGSASALSDYEDRHPGVAPRTLAYFDAALAAKRLSVPCHLACALFDPAVAPPGQFAAYNALPNHLRKLFVLTAGHHEYAAQEKEGSTLLRELCEFFS